MKIAIFTDTFLPQTNGIVTATINLAKGMADRGHHVYILAPKFPKEKEFSYTNITIKRVPSIPAFFYQDFKFVSPYSRKVLEYIKKEKIEIIHFQAPVTIAIQAIRISKKLKIPLVGTFHTFISDPAYLKHIKLNYNAVVKLAWAYTRAYYNKCNLITCPSENTKKELLKNNLTNNIQVISNGMDTNIFDNSKAKEVKAKYAPKGNLLLFIGRIAHEKNLFYLVDCMKLVCNEMPETKLIMVGGGPQMDEIKEKIKSLKLQNNIILLGEVKYNELIKSSIFGASDLFLTASVTENQPMTILEAQANGLVCVGARARGIPNLIKDNYNGYTIIPGDKQAFANAIIKLLKDKKLRKKMEENTNTEIKNHEISQVIDTWEKTYNQLIKNYH